MENRTPNMEICVHDTIFTGAKTVLQVMVDEYTKERERTSIIENKATVLITILVALLTVYIPIIPFEEIINIYQKGTTTALVVLVIACTLFVEALVITVIAFTKLIGVIKLHTYRRVAVTDLVADAVLQASDDVIEKELCEHYCDLILINSEVNDKKAKGITNCFVLTIISFMLLLTSILIVLIL